MSTSEAAGPLAAWGTRAPGYTRRWRLDGLAAALGVAVAAAGVAVAASGVSGAEAWVFRLLNGLPDLLERTMWLAQRGGLLLVPLGVAVIAALARRWRLALALALLVPAKLFVEYLGAHNPLDVVVGGAAGVAIAALLNLLVGVPGGRR